MRSDSVLLIFTLWLLKAPNRLLNCGCLLDCEDVGEESFSEVHRTSVCFFV